MIAKTLALFALVAAASAGVVFNSFAPHHSVDDLGSVGAQSEQTVRGFNGFGGPQTISHQTKAVDSAFSSVRKHDTRVINPAVAAYAAPVFHQPALVAQPAVAAYHAPTVVAAPALAHGSAVSSGSLLGQPTHYHFDSPVLGHFSY